MRKLSEIKNIHAGKPAAILGGGPSLRADMERLPADCVKFAVNDHAFHIGVQPDYLVMMDDPSIKPELERLAQGGPYTRVNELLAHTDIDLRGVPRPTARTGIFTAWLALYLGCMPVLLCGMDLYQGAQKYCHPHDDFMGDKPIYNEPVEKLMNDWATLKRYKGHKRIQVMSGPLMEVFK